MSLRRRLRISADSGPSPTLSCVGPWSQGSRSFSLCRPVIAPQPRCWSQPCVCRGHLLDAGGVLGPAGWAFLPLFDLQDGWVGLHDGHNDPVNVILQAEVYLLLLLNGVHELREERCQCWLGAHTVARLGSRDGPYLISGDGADLCSQGLREGRGEEVLGALDTQVDDLPVELVILLLQVTVILGGDMMAASFPGPGARTGTGQRGFGLRPSAPAPPARPPPHAGLLEVSAGYGGVCPHLLQPADLLLQLALTGTAVVLLQAHAAAPAPPLLRLQLEKLQVLQLLAQVLDQLRATTG